MLLGAPGLTTRNKDATSSKCIATSSKDAMNVSTRFASVRFVSTGTAPPNPSERARYAKRLGVG